VSSSSVGRGNPVSILDKISTEFWTSDVPASWIQVGLGSTRSLCPNYYTLRHGSNSKSDALRNWTLQGSVNGKDWVVLKRHINDMALNSNFATASFPIADCKQSFHYFRVLQTGHNSSYTNYLSLSGFELYGDLTEQDKKDGYTSP